MRYPGKAWHSQTDWDNAQSSDELVARGGSIIAYSIPAPGDLHARYDATNLSHAGGDSVSTWPDETGNGYDLTAGTAPTYQTGVISGKPVVRFNGTDQFLDVGFTALSQPNHIFAVFKFHSTPSTSENELIVDSGATHYHGLYNNGFDDNDWAIFAGSQVGTSTTADTSPHIAGGLFDGASSEVRVDGSVVNTGDAGTNSLDGLVVGTDHSQSDFASVDVGEVLVYPQDKSDIADDVMQYLNDKWGVF